jgi:hypothetical protein
MNKLTIISLTVFALLVAAFVIYTKKKDTNTDSENDFFPPARNNDGVHDIGYYHRKFGDVDM